MADSAQMLINAATHVPSLTKVGLVISALVGFVLTGKGLIAWAQQDKAGSQKLSGSTIWLIVGGMLLMSLPSFVDLVSHAIFRDEKDVKLLSSYNPYSGSERIRAVIQAIVAWINLVGLYAAFTGLKRWATGPDSGQPDFFSKGLAYLIAGVLCMNFAVFINFLAGTFGLTPLGTEYFNY